MEVRGSISVVLVVLFVENKRNIKCVDVSEIQMSDSARAGNVSSFPFLRMTGPPTSRVVWPSSGRRLANPRPYFLSPLKFDHRILGSDLSV